MYCTAYCVPRYVDPVFGVLVPGCLSHLLSIGTSHTPFDLPLDMLPPVSHFLAKKPKTRNPLCNSYLNTNSQSSPVQPNATSVHEYRGGGSNLNSESRLIKLVGVNLYVVMVCNYIAVYSQYLPKYPFIAKNALRMQFPLSDRKFIKSLTSHFPLKTGFLFSLKAAKASSLSSVPTTRPYISFSTSSLDHPTALNALLTATGPPSQIVPAR